MVNKTDKVVFKLSSRRNIFNNAHALYSYTDYAKEMKLIEMYRWNYSETPAFHIRKV